MFGPGRRQTANSFQLAKGSGDRNQGQKSWETSNSGFWAPKPAQNYREVHFGTERKDMDDSGICSPPLWTTSPPRSPQHRKNHYRSLSPESRTKAIERGQRELMEIVRTMPESNYELSLKDLVEHHRVDVRAQDTIEEKNLSQKNSHRREGSGRKIDNKAQGRRSGGIDSAGFYLKMVFPTSLGSKKKKKDESLTSNSAKVSPRPSVSDGSVKGVVDKEWRNKGLSASVESDSGASSINTGSLKSSGSSSSSSSSNGSSRSNSRHEKRSGGCLPFIRRPKLLTQK